MYRELTCCPIQSRIPTVHGTEGTSNRDLGKYGGIVPLEVTVPLCSFKAFDTNQFRNPKFSNAGHKYKNARRIALRSIAGSKKATITNVLTAVMLRYALVESENKEILEIDIYCIRRRSKDTNRKE